MADLLESELARELCAVSAPEGLWRRIHEQQRPLRVMAHPWRKWSIAAAVALMLLAGVVWRLGAALGTTDPKALAEWELRNPAMRSQGSCVLCHADLPAAMVLR